MGAHYSNIRVVNRMDLISGQTIAGDTVLGLTPASMGIRADEAIVGGRLMAEISGNNTSSDTNLEYWGPIFRESDTGNYLNPGQAEHTVLTISAGSDVEVTAPFENANEGLSPLSAKGGMRLKLVTAGTWGQGEDFVFSLHGVFIVIS